MTAYAAAKARIFRRAGVAVLNLDDPLVAALPTGGARRVGFTLQQAAGADYHLAGSGGALALACRGEPLLPLAALRIAGRHNAANALAALALADALGLPRAAQLAELREFPAWRTARSGWRRSAACATSTIPRGPTSARRWRRSRAWTRRCW
ncbi:MAG: Mur ligase family protein [Steroidobacteraceae bacterium]